MVPWLDDTWVVKMVAVSWCSAYTPLCRLPVTISKDDLEVVWAVLCMAGGWMMARVWKKTCCGQGLMWKDWKLRDM